MATLSTMRRGRRGRADTAAWVERAGGLVFQCVGCGGCCRGEDGYVWLETADVERLAEHLGLSHAAFGKRYLRRVDGELCLTDGPTGDCVFLEPGRGCVVYEARPVQCRTFPFWAENLDSPGAWRKGTRSCPGCRVRKGARRYSRAEALEISVGARATGRSRGGGGGRR